MFNKIIKSYKVSIGTPYHVKTPIDIENRYLENDYIDKDNKDGKNGKDTYTKALVNELYFKDPGDSIDIEGIIKTSQREADDIIRGARKEGLRILEECEKEAQKSRIQIEEAKIKGYKEGLLKAKKEYSEKLKEVQDIKEKTIEEYKQTLSNIEGDIVEIILNTLRKVLYIEKVQNKGIILRLIREVIDNCTYKNEITLKVSPADYDYITSNRKEFDSILGDIENFEIKKDPTLQDGNCIVKTPCGSVTTGINTKLVKIEKAFKGQEKES